LSSPVRNKAKPSSGKKSVLVTSESEDMSPQRFISKERKAGSAHTTSHKQKKSEAMKLSKPQKQSTVKKKVSFFRNIRGYICTG